MCEMRIVRAGTASKDQKTKKAFPEFEAGVKSPYPIVASDTKEKYTDWKYVHPVNLVSGARVPWGH